MSRGASLRLRLPWVVVKLWIFTRLTLHGLRRWRWDWVRVAWKALFL